ncbi:helix-turn-helix domain-containing protein [Anaerosalibacter massiliensis]|uniref:helix-turn-helix domain-containing protein n=1 Tax=Anaerosalibacter massiliensis TaxID=1347392 RepID=UPI0005B2A1BE|nr:helix-turn-helix transcriptional regulator [Anaerosalibacter massiliensis]
MFGDRLKKLRKERHITQEELAKNIGVSTSMVGMYETGARKASYKVLVKISKYFNVSTDYLLGKTEEKKETIGVVKESKASYNSDNLEEDFPEGVYVLRRASKELSPEAKKQMIKIMKTFLEEEDE